MDQQTLLSVSGMSCSSCVKHINQALGGLDGVKAVDVSLKEHTVVVRNGSELSSDRLLAVLADAGYEGRVSV